MNDERTTPDPEEPATQPIPASDSTAEAPGGPHPPSGPSGGPSEDRPDGGADAQDRAAAPDGVAAQESATSEAPTSWRERLMNARAAIAVGAAGLIIGASGGAALGFAATGDGPEDLGGPGFGRGGPPNGQWDGHRDGRGDFHGTPPDDLPGAPPDGSTPDGSSPDQTTPDDTADQSTTGQST